MAGPRRHICSLVGHWISDASQCGPMRVHWQCRICRTNQVSCSGDFEAAQARQGRIVDFAVFILIWTVVYALDSAL